MRSRRIIRGPGVDKQVALDQKYLPLFAKAPQSDDRDWMISHLHADLLQIRAFANGRKTRFLRRCDRIPKRRAFHARDDHSFDGPAGP